MTRKTWSATAGKFVRTPYRPKPKRKARPPYVSKALRSLSAGGFFVDGLYFFGPEYICSPPFTPQINWEFAQLPQTLPHQTPIELSFVGDEIAVPKVDTDQS